MVLFWRMIARLLVALVLVGATVGCARTPARSGLVDKLEQRNALTPAQAACVADGLYDGIPTARPAVRPLSGEELRAVAEPDNAGKVSNEALEIIREVIGHCVPDERPATEP